MKKTMRIVISFIVLVTLFSFTACNSNNGDNNNGGNGNNNELNFATVYAMAQEAGYTGTLEELIAAFKGDNAYQIAVNNGCTLSEADWLASLIGASGKDGKDGITPHIDTESGYWYIGTTNTGVKAKGTDGSNGKNGKSAYELAVENGFDGTLEEWLLSLVGGDGINGKSVDSFAINASGELIIYYSDSTSENLGKITGSNGSNGIDGKSAYDIWKEIHGNGSSTEQDFLVWIKGQDGSNGKDGNDGDKGDSAYDIFMKYNPDYPENEEQWINDLVLGRLTRITITFKSVGNDDIIRTPFLHYPLADIPEVPAKIGNVGTWDIVDFSNISADITVNAIYETQGLSFTLINGDTEYSVSIGQMNEYTQELFIPMKHLGKPVTNIDAPNFNYYTNLNSIFVDEENPNYSTQFGILFNKNKTTLVLYPAGNIRTIFEIPNSVTKIDPFAFYCAKLTSITIPDSVITIDNSAFYCAKLTSIIIPSNVTTVGREAFAGTSLQVITFESGSRLTNINTRTFDGCAYLQTVTFESGSQLTAIGSNAFENCRSLTSITIPSSVKHIGAEVFRYCTNLQTITFESGSQLISIGDGAFLYCSSLMSIIIPSSVTSIGANAFAGFITVTIYIEVASVENGWNEY